MRSKNKVTEKRYGICKNCGSLAVGYKKGRPCLKCDSPEVGEVCLEFVWANQKNEIFGLKREVKRLRRGFELYAVLVNQGQLVNSKIITEIGRITGKVDYHRNRVSIKTILRDLEEALQIRKNEMEILKEDMESIRIDRSSWFYKNCKRQRKAQAKICQVCPFRNFIEEREERAQEKDQESN